MAERINDTRGPKVRTKWERVRGLVDPNLNSADRRRALETGLRAATSETMRLRYASALRAASPGDHLIDEKIRGIIFYGD